MTQGGGGATKQELEPGLLPVFRLIMVVTLALQTVTFGLTLYAFWVGEIEQLPHLLLLSLLVEWVAVLLLLCYLYSETLTRMTGRWYLPLAVALYSAGAIIQRFYFVFQVVTTPWLLREITADGSTFDLVDSGWSLLVALLVPVVIVAWQYDFRRVLLYLGTITLFELPFILLLIRYAPELDRASDPPLMAFILVIRPIIFCAVGYIVTRMIGAQRQQRQELTLANDKLRQQATMLEQLTISRERNRLARELHDTLAHSLSAVAVQLEAVDSTLENSPAEARLLLTKALAQTRSGLAETRRAMQSLRATPLDDLGLKLALQSLATVTAQRGGLQLALDLAEIPELPPVTEQNLYRIAQEALANVLKHANASRLAIRLEQVAGKTRLVVHDDGVGFDLATIRRNGHFGLEGIEERAALIDGTISVKSQPGRGTTIELLV
ncbi:MAG: sensor histidine kinase [Caldilineaceae bacterium]